MKKIPSASLDDLSGPYDRDGTTDDLWFLPGPPEDEPAFLPPGPAQEPTEASVLDEWTRAEAGHAARLARVAGRLGALDERLKRGPAGWRQRLALMEAADLSWINGGRVAPDRLALWVALRVSGVQDDTQALARLGWAVRRLGGGPGPEAGLPEFLGRHDAVTTDDAAGLFTERAGAWEQLMKSAAHLHPVTRACMGYHLWALAGLVHQGDGLEAAVTAARIAASEGQGAVFAPMAMGGAVGLRANGTPDARLKRWYDGMDAALLTALRHLDQIDAWDARAETAMARLSGRTPPALRRAMADWPLLSAPMAEFLTGASRAAVQRNLAWMEDNGLIREMTGQGRFRMWRAMV
ncbi:hypothetical protein [Roseinatronobacter alkalisoli]|uniref:HTH DNA binding domain-containing protein n=1 Tax=Roseinatronobacter alkalisoli TaxID=3028235 RepID=A0ABT5TAV4_9RHOB|nr:hypothetical protein [Roseinatronobacter sp. HJB301]MDD7972247.1 hypothetical protein [Roseinatronobacter sp. HJB301]